MPMIDAYLGDVPNLSAEQLRNFMKDVFDFSEIREKSRMAAGMSWVRGLEGAIKLAQTSRADFEFLHCQALRGKSPIIQPSAGNRDYYAILRAALRILRADPAAFPPCSLGMV